MFISKEELKKQLAEAGVSLTGDEDWKALQELGKQHLKKASNVGKTSGEGSILVWLKIRAYVSNTQRVNAGVYQLNRVPERLAKLSSNMCEVFADGNVPPRKLTEIAKWAGIKYPEEKTDEDILSIVISAYKPFGKVK